jgi:hypothetical protein
VLLRELYLQLLILLQNPMRPLLPLERFGYWNNQMIMMRLLYTITPASATEGSPAVFEFSLSNLLLLQ